MCPGVHQLDKGTWQGSPRRLHWIAVGTLTVDEG